MDTAVATPTAAETPKAPKAKAAPKAAAKADAKPGIRLPQARILKALAASKKPLTRGELIAKVSRDPDHPTAIGDALGVTDPKNRPVREKAAGYKSLITLGLVKEHHLGGPGEEVNETVHEITAAGRKALEKYGKIPA